MIPRLLLTLFLIAVVGGGVSAQVEGRLAINRGVLEANMQSECSAAAAEIFYEVLDDGEYLLEGYDRLLSEGRYTAVSHAIETLNDAYFNPSQQARDCLPSAANFFAIGAVLAYRAVRHFDTSAAPIEAERILPLMREMASLDLPLYDAGYVRAGELVLNLTFMEIPRCSVTQAKAFYDTYDGYRRQLERQRQMYDVQSMRRWLRGYESWVAANWAPF